MKYREIPQAARRIAIICSYGKAKTNDWRSSAGMAVENARNPMTYSRSAAIEVCLKGGAEQVKGIFLKLKRSVSARSAAITATSAVWPSAIRHPQKRA